MSIEIINYKDINKGSLQGYVDIYVKKMGLEIYGCTVFSKDGKRWINFPQKETEKDGEKKYFSIVRFREKSHMETFCRYVLEALDLWIAQNQKPVEQHVQGEMPF